MAVPFFKMKSTRITVEGPSPPLPVRRMKEARKFGSSALCFLHAEAASPSAPSIEAVGAQKSKNGEWGEPH